MQADSMHIRYTDEDVERMEGEIQLEREARQAFDHGCFLSWLRGIKVFEHYWQRRGRCRS